MPRASLSDVLEVQPEISDQAPVKRASLSDVVDVIPEEPKAEIPGTEKLGPPPAPFTVGGAMVEPVGGPAPSIYGVPSGQMRIPQQDQPQPVKPLIGPSTMLPVQPQARAPLVKSAQPQGSPQIVEEETPPPVFDHSTPDKAIMLGAPVKVGPIQTVAQPKPGKNDAAQALLDVRDLILGPAYGTALKSDSKLESLINGMVRATSGFSTPEGVATMLVGAGLASKLPELVNSSTFVKKVAQYPALAKGIDIASRAGVSGTVSAMGGYGAATNLYQGIKEGNLEKVGQGLADLAIGAAAGAHAVKSGAEAADIYPVGEIPPATLPGRRGTFHTEITEQARPEGVEPVGSRPNPKAQTGFAAATGEAQALAQQGQNLAAEVWLQRAQKLGASLPTEQLQIDGKPYTVRQTGGGTGRNAVFGLFDETGNKLSEGKKIDIVRDIQRRSQLAGVAPENPQAGTVRDRFESALQSGSLESAIQEQAERLLAIRQMEEALASGQPPQMSAQANQSFTPEQRIEMLRQNIAAHQQMYEDGWTSLTNDLGDRMSAALRSRVETASDIGEIMRAVEAEAETPGSLRPTVTKAPEAVTVEEGSTYETPQGKVAVTKVQGDNVSYTLTMPDGHVITHILPMEKFRRAVFPQSTPAAAPPAAAPGAAQPEAPATPPAAAPAPGQPVSPEPAPVSTPPIPVAPAAGEAVAPPAPTIPTSTPASPVGEAPASENRVLPWQLPGQAYSDYEASVLGESPKPISERYTAWHKAQVLQALRAGENVPANVLAEYSDLVPQPVPPAPPGEEVVQPPTAEGEGAGTVPPPPGSTAPEHTAGQPAGAAVAGEKRSRATDEQIQKEIDSAQEAWDKNPQWRESLREGDPEIRDTVVFPDGRQHVIVKSWRTADAKSPDGKLHITLINETGHAYGIDGRDLQNWLKEGAELKVPGVETLRYRTKGNDKIDVYITHDEGKGWTANADWNLQGQAGGHLGDSGYNVWHPTREAAIEAFLKSAIRPGNGPQYELDSKSQTPVLRARAQKMKDWLESLRPKPPGTHANASTQVNLSPETAKMVTDFGATIPEAERAPQGLEPKPHITIRYGSEDSGQEAIAAALAGHGPIKAKIKTLSIFPNVDTENGKADVLKLDIDSPDLRKLNAAVGSAAPHPGETHPKYKPHITVAYLKPGEGKKYAGRAIPGLSGQTITFDSAEFSPTSGEPTQIPLGKAEAAPAPAGVRVEDGTAKKLYPLSVGVEELRISAKPALDIRKEPTGWLRRDTERGAFLVHPTEDRVVRFEAENERSGTDVLRARMHAGAYAVDNPIATPPSKPSGDLVVQPIFSGQPPAPVKVTDKSVRDFPVTVVLKDGTITATVKLGQKPIGKITIKASEWPKSKFNGNGKVYDNPLYHQRELVRKAMEQAGIADFNAEGAGQAERIADAITSATNKALGNDSMGRRPEETAPGPGPKIEQILSPGAWADTFQEGDRIGFDWNQKPIEATVVGRQGDYLVVQPDNQPGMTIQVYGTSARQENVKRLSRAEEPPAPPTPAPTEIPSVRREGNQFVSEKDGTPVAEITKDGMDAKLLPPWDQLTGADRHTLLGAIEHLLLNPEPEPGAPAEKPLSERFPKGQRVMYFSAGHTRRFGAVQRIDEHGTVAPPSLSVKEENTGRIVNVNASEATRVWARGDKVAFTDEQGNQFRAEVWDGIPNDEGKIRVKIRHGNQTFNAKADDVQKSEHRRDQIIYAGKEPKPEFPELRQGDVVTADLGAARGGEIKGNVVTVYGDETVEVRVTPKSGKPYSETVNLDQIQSVNGVPVGEQQAPPPSSPAAPEFHSSAIESRYPEISGRSVDGLQVLPVDEGDIESAESHDELAGRRLPGVRVIPVSAIRDAIIDLPSNRLRDEELNRDITESGEITPVIVAVSESNPGSVEVIEGIHRAGSFARYGRNNIPAVIYVEPASAPVRTPAEKAADIWESMDENQRAGVRMGLFPADVMRMAEAEGFTSQELSVALMEHARQAGEKTGPDVGGFINAVYQKLKSGQALGNVTELNKLAEKYLGGSRTSGAWTPKDAFDAMEAGINKVLVERGEELLRMPYEDAMRELRDLMDRVTSQGVRTAEQEKFQQFSTPPTEAFTAAKVAGLRPDDIMLESSAGNGGLAVFPWSIGAEVHVNEISDRRRQMLAAVGFDHITGHDGEVINALLPSVRPTVMIINPPFSAGGAKSGPAKNNNKYGFNHVNAALQALAPNGRAVIILGGGRANDPNGGATLRGGPSGQWFSDIAKRYNVRANVRISGKEYQKYGTAFATRLIVIDKTGPTPSRMESKPSWSSVVEGNVDTLEEAYNLLRGVADDRPQIQPRSGGEAGTRAGEPRAPKGATGSQPGERGSELPSGGGGTDQGGPVVGGPELGRPPGAGGELRPGGLGEPTGLHQPGPGSEGSDALAGAGATESTPPSADYKQPVPGADDLGAIPGLDLQGLIDDIADGFGQLTGLKPTAPPKAQKPPQKVKAAEPKVKPPKAAKPKPAEKPSPATSQQPKHELETAAEDALQALRDRLGKRLAQKPPLQSLLPPTRNVTPDPESIKQIGIIGVKAIVLDKADTYQAWFDRMMSGETGDFVQLLADDGNSTPDRLLRQIYELSRAAAARYGATAHPAPPPEEPKIDEPLTGDELNVPLKLVRDTEPKAEQEDTSAYVTYRPTIKGPAHPGTIVETKTMATVPLPEITYQPRLPQSVIDQGKLSAVQLEAIAIAGQQNEIILPGGARASALIGDGTGVGKGRIAAGIMWDNWRQGRKKIVFVTEKWDLMQDILRDLEGIGAKELLAGAARDKNGQFVVQSTAAVKPFNKIDYGNEIKHSGILFSTYGTVRGENKKGESRLDQLVEWLKGENDDGEGAVLVLDECVPAGTMIETPGGRVEIEDLKVGDTVLGLNHDTGAIEPTIVLHTFRRVTTDPVVRIEDTDMTGNHPVWTENRGYVRADGILPIDRVGKIERQSACNELRVVPAAISQPILLPELLGEAHLGSSMEGQRSDGLDMRVVRGGHSDNPIESRPERQPESLLQHAMLGIVADEQPHAQGAKKDQPSGAGVLEAQSAARSRDARRPGEVAPASDREEQPVSQTRGAAEVTGNHEQEGIRAPEWRERKGASCACPDVVGTVGVADRGDRSLRTESIGQGQSHILSDRHRGSSAEDRGRGRWDEPQVGGDQRIGQAEGSIPRLERLDSSAVLESPYPNRLRKRGGGDYGSREVFNIETGTGNYFANSLLVHNCHNLKNAVVGQGGQASQIGVKARQLLQRLPRLRTTSLSATAATDVMNLGYLDRLGLWGPGTAFPNGFNEFASEVSGGGLAAMEMIARELKAQGKYLSRTLSFHGVTYDVVERPLNQDQRSIYRTATQAWRSVVQEVEQSIATRTNGGGLQKSRFMSQFGAAQLRFFGLLITALKTPAAVELANKALADGKSVVITLVNTNEAAQNREKERVAAETDEDEIPDYDFGPKRMLIDLVREHYPIHQWMDDVDDQGNPVKRPVMTIDSEGREVQAVNEEAREARDALIERLEKDLNMPDNPLDILINNLGGDSKVAELTGRKEKFDSSTGKFVARGGPNVKKSDINIVEMRNFQSGKKRVAVLSNAAGTGISLHAGNDVGNKQKRVHITLQNGWSADKAMQMFGRTHRTNQAHSPEYVLLVSDLGGERRFISTIARRLGSLGAITKGQKDAASGTDLMEKANFETDQGSAAARAFYEQLLQDVAIPGTDIDGEPLRGRQILVDLRVLKGAPPTVPNADRGNVPKLLNRLLAIDPDNQNPTYNYFYDIFQAVVKKAIEENTLDTGVKVLPGDTFDIVEQRPIAKDQKTGAETFYYAVDAHLRTHRVSPEELEQRIARRAADTPVVAINDKGKLFLTVQAPAIVHANGRTEEASYVCTPGDGRWKKVANATIRAVDVNEWGQAGRDKIQREIESREHDLEWQRERMESALDYAKNGPIEAAERELSIAEKKRERLDQPFQEPPAGRWVHYGGNNWKVLFEGRTRFGHKMRLERNGEEKWVKPQYTQPAKWETAPPDLEAAKRDADAAVSAAHDKVEKAKEAAESVQLPETNYDLQRVRKTEAELEDFRKQLAERQAIAGDPMAWAREQWQKQYDEAPTHETETHHLIGGAVMRYWNPIREATGLSDIFTTTDSKTGQRIVGVDIPQNAIRPLLNRIEGGKSTVNAGQIVDDVLRNGTNYTLEGGIQVRRGTVSRSRVIQIVPATDAQAQNLMRMGVLYEKGITPIYYVPTGDDVQEPIVKQILKEYPAREVEGQALNRATPPLQSLAPPEPFTTAENIDEPVSVPPVDVSSLRMTPNSREMFDAVAFPAKINGMPALAVNQHAMEAIVHGSGLAGKADRILGLAVTPDEWNAFLESAKATPPDHKATPGDKAIARVAVAMRQAIGPLKDHPLIVIQTSPQAIHENDQIRKAAEHEFDHAQQILLGDGLSSLPDEMLDSVEGQIALDELVRKGYSRPIEGGPWYRQRREVMAAEVGVRLMRPGLFRQLNLTVDQARVLAARYIVGLEQRHGAKAGAIIRQTYATIEANRRAYSSEATVRGTQPGGPETVRAQHAPGAERVSNRGPSGAGEVPEGDHQGRPAEGREPLAARRPPAEREEQKRAFLADETGSSTVNQAIREAIDRFRATDKPQRNYGDLIGGTARELKRGLTPGSNLIQVESASKPVFEKALAAGSWQSIASTMTRTAVNAINRTLDGTDYNWLKMRAVLTQDRLDALRNRWNEFADTFEAADDEQTAELMQAAGEDGRSFFLGLLDNIEGKKGLPEDLQQSAAAMLDREDWEGLRMMMADVFHDAANGVTDIMPRDMFDSMAEFFDTDPKGKKALDIYTNDIEEPLGKIHEENEGVFTDTRGPRLGKYIPLTPFDPKPPELGGRRLPLHKPKNPSNYFATGLSDSYSLSMPSFVDRIARDVRANKRAALIKTLREEGWIQSKPRGWDGTFFGPDGRSYEAVAKQVSEARTIVRDGKVTHIPGHQAIIPLFMWNGLKPMLEKDAPSYHDLNRVAHWLNGLALKATPAELVFHSAGVIGALISNTPFIGKTGLDKVLSLPVIRAVSILGKLASIDPEAPENLAKLREMAESGAVPSKMGKVTFDKDFAEAFGVKRELTFAPFLYGPSGVDARARVLMYDIFQAAYPNGTKSDMYHFVNQVGNYTPEFQGLLERWAKSVGVGPFATAGMTRLVNAFHAWTGTGPGTPKSRILQQFMGGALAAIALWVIAYRYLTGKWPTEDKEAKLLQFPVSTRGNGKLDQIAKSHLEIGRALWGDDWVAGKNVGYLNFGATFPMVTRGSRLFGLAGGFETANLGGSGRQVRDAMLVDAVNSLTHPFKGPAAQAAFIFATGLEPSLTAMQERGKPAMKFFPAYPNKLKPGFFGGLTPAVVPGQPRKNPGAPAEFGAKTAASISALNGFYGDIGSHTGFLGSDENSKGLWYVTLPLSLILPNVVKNATKPYAKAEMLRKDRAGVR